MTLFLPLLTSFAALVSLCIATHQITDWLEVVPHFADLAKFYRQTRMHNGKRYDLSSDLITAPYTKNIVCWNLFNSGVFHLDDFEPIDMQMASTYFELKLFHPNIVEYLYEDVPVFVSGMEFGDFVYSNDTLVRHLPPGNEPELVFICLARNRLTRKIVTYYVSEEYNVSPTSYVAARFMFKVVNGQLKVSHYAEEPATVLTGLRYNLKHLYLQAKEGKKIASTPNTDPYCRLGLVGRMQVCTSVFTAQYFDDMFHYEPDVPYVSQDCIKGKVALENELSDYEEWMIRCVVKRKDGASVSYYVSQAYSRYKAFVYRMTERFSTEAMSLEYMCINVRNFK